MNALLGLLGVCSSVQNGKGEEDKEEGASEIQLNAFEFRNFRTSLEEQQQQVVECIVNQWCAMLVRGKAMRVDGFDSKVFMDKDLLVLEYRDDFYPLRTMAKMELFKEADDMLASAAPYGLDITFEGDEEPRTLKFNFDAERQRLNFALTLRILRTRDPALDPQSTVVVEGRDEVDDDERQTFHRIVSAQHYNIEAGIPIVFSVSDLKLYEKLRSSSRHTYLEFFVRYPRQDRFLYAKSPTTPIPQQVLLVEDLSMRRKKDKKEENDEDEEAKKKEELKRQVLGDQIPICAMRFELKNVKLKVPKVPHQVFGRLMAKDDYFPTAIGTFSFQVTKSHLQNRMKDIEERSKGNKREKELPETMRIPMHSAWKMRSQDGKEETFAQIGTLTMRLMGYVTESHWEDDSPRSGPRTPATPSAPPGGGSGDDRPASEPGPPPTDTMQDGPARQGSEQAGSKASLGSRSSSSGASSESSGSDSESASRSASRSGGASRSGTFSSGK